MREDKEANQELYGKELTSKEVLNDPHKVPESANQFVAALTKYSGRGGK